MKSHVLALCLAAAACAGPSSYQSTYVPPDDGRARVVWGDGNIVADGADVTCTPPEIRVPEPGLRPIVRPKNDRPRTVEPLVEVRAGYSGHRTHFGRLVPSPRGTGTAGSSPVAQVNRGAAAPKSQLNGIRNATRGKNATKAKAKTKGGSGGAAGVGGVGGGGDGEGVVLLAAVALMAISLVTISVAATPANNESIGAAIDEVNAHNDCVGGELR